MLVSRPAIAADPLEFGKRFDASEQADLDIPGSLAADVRLFALTFAAGFLFVSIFLI